MPVFLRRDTTLIGRNERKANKQANEEHSHVIKNYLGKYGIK